VDFQVDGRPDVYRADFTKMVQRNVQSGAESPLRSLVSLSIKNGSGYASQTAEINMAHHTVITDMRNELAKYLKDDETRLRLMYGNRVLRRADYQHVTIRDGTVALGSEVLVVTKMKPGEVEDRCTYALTGHTMVDPTWYECASYGFDHGRVFRGTCAQVCHAEHAVRPVSTCRSPGCHAVASAGRCTRGRRALLPAVHVHGPQRVFLVRAEQRVRFGEDGDGARRQRRRQGVPAGYAHVGVCRPHHCDHAHVGLADHQRPGVAPELQDGVEVITASSGSSAPYMFNLDNVVPYVSGETMHLCTQRTGRNRARLWT